MRITLIEALTSMFSMVVGCVVVVMALAYAFGILDKKEGAWRRSVKSRENRLKERRRIKNLEPEKVIKARHAYPKSDKPC